MESLVRSGGDATTSETIRPQIAKSVHTDPQCSSQLNTNPPALHQDTRTWTPQPQDPNLKEPEGHHKRMQK